MSEVRTLTGTFLGYDVIASSDKALSYDTRTPSSTLVAYYSTLLIKFKTPDFVGVSKGVEIRLAFPDNETYPPKDKRVRYALSSSDENWKDYQHTTGMSELGDVSESYQLTSGMLTITAAGTYTITIESKDLKPSTEYYFFLWDAWKTSGGYSGVTIGVPTPFVSINYWGGVVYIDNGTELVAYQPYIDNGSGWDQVIPHIDNGKSWNMYS